MTFLLASPRPAALREFSETLAAGSAHEVIHAATAASALELAASHAPKLVVIDEGLPDKTPLQLASALLHVNAMIFTAVVSPSTDEEFHEESEGLGVLMRLPVAPGADDAHTLLRTLTAVAP